MNDVMHGLLDKLRIVGTIKEGQKLDTTYGLNVYTEGWINWLFRKWHRDNKDEGMRQLCDLYKSLQQSIETVISASKHSTDSTMINYVLLNSAKELRHSVKGLENLCKTYANCPATPAKIKGIIMDYVIVTYSSLMSCIPRDKLTPELRESITFNGVVVYEGEDGIHTFNISPKLGPSQNLQNTQTVQNTQNTEGNPFDEPDYLDEKDQKEETEQKTVNSPHARKNKRK